MVKVRGQIAGIARLLVDEDEKIKCILLYIMFYYETIT